jgi:hypothetical protein
MQSPNLREGTRMNKDEIDQAVRSLSKDEMRARTTAEAMGQLKIIEAAIAALIMTSPHGEVVKAAILGMLDDLGKAKPAHPSIAWSPPVVLAGAKAAAKRILKLHESVKANVDLKKRGKPN